MRFGHRKGRDTRITTHVGLVARAFGADRFVMAGSDATGPLKTLEDICERWGGSGSFRTGSVKNWKSEVRNFKSKGGIVIHLTMYGIPLSKTVPGIRRLLAQDKDLLIFVGAEKVPPEIYELADFNVAVGNQPHSEVAALAVFLDRLFDGGKIEDARSFPGAKIAVIPQEHGKATREK